jgi:hypothetical protein
MLKKKRRKESKPFFEDTIEAYNADDDERKTMLFGVM